MKWIIKQYNKFASSFVELHSNLDTATNACYFPRFEGLLKNKKVLDLGCGEGKDLQYFKEQGARIYGIDISERMIELAQKNLPDAQIKLGLFEKIPFEKDAFDVVASKYALQTSGTIDPTYKEIHRVLKKDGVAILVMTHPIRQFMEKRYPRKDYFKKEIVDSVLFGGKLTVQEESHTLLEYFSPYFFKHFELLDYDEKFDPTNAEMVRGESYPAFMLIKFRKK